MAPSTSLRARWLQFKFNLFPCYRRTGVKVVFIAADLREVHIRLPLNWKTKGYFGTTFGGSIYGAVDPVYMVMLNMLLGAEYIVWDKAAKIDFKRPGRATLNAEFVVSVRETQAIVDALVKTGKIERVYTVDLIDDKGQICASVEKTLHIRRRRGTNK